MNDPYFVSALRIILRFCGRDSRVPAPGSATPAAQKTQGANSTTRWLQRWNTFWFAEGPPHALAIMRIAVGSFLLLIFLRLSLHIPMLLSHEGLLMPLYEETLFVLMPQIFLTPPVWITWMLYALLITSLVGFTTGVHFRVSSFVAIVLIAHFFFLNLYPLPSTGHYLTYFFLIVLACSGADRALSVTSTCKNASALEVSLLPQRLIAVQITALYVGVSLQKLTLAGWQDGEILYYAFQSAWGLPLAWWIVRLPLFMTFYATVVFLVKSFELMLPFGLWMKSTQRWFMLAGALFHIFIAFLFGMWEFLVLIPLYIAFVDPHRVAACMEQRVHSG
jgi:hypothetical protein